MRRASTAVLLLSAALSLQWHTEARSAGVYLDASRETGFLLSGHRATFDSRMILCRDGADVTQYVASAAFPAREYLLVEVEQNYITVSGGSTIFSGFGDTRIRSRTRLWQAPRRVLHLLAGVTAGNGNTRLYPYSSQTIDMELALGFVDSTAGLRWWAVAGGARVERVPKQVRDGDDVLLDLSEEQLHGHYLRAGAGVELPVRDLFGVIGGAAAVRYRTGAVRVLLFGQARYYHTDQFVLHADVQVEAGDTAERVNDASLAAGLTVRF